MTTQRFFQFSMMNLLKLMRKYFNFLQIFRTFDLISEKESFQDQFDCKKYQANITKIKRLKSIKMKAMDLGSIDLDKLKKNKTSIVLNLL